MPYSHGVETPLRQGVFPTLLVLAVAEVVNLAAGVHYVRADGGYPARTNGNHLGGWIYLATAAVILVAIVVIVRLSRTTRTVLVVGLLTVAVSIGGFVAGQAAIRNGASCACEGG